MYMEKSTIPDPNHTCGEELSSWTILAVIFSVFRGYGTDLGRVYDRIGNRTEVLGRQCDLIKPTQATLLLRLSINRD